MNLNRREVLKYGAYQLIAFSLIKEVEASETSLNQNLKSNLPSILQGATDESNTQFSILIDNSLTISAFVVDENNNTIYADKKEEYVFKGHNKKILKYFFSNLDLVNKYNLTIVDNLDNKVIDTREFKLLNTNKDHLRFAICSCMDDKYHRPEIWRDIISKSPDIIFFVGDFAYTDRGHRGAAKPAQLWSRFCDARTTLDIFFSPVLIPILATWDDHDFGQNDSNSENYPYVKESQLNFNSFFVQDESHCRFLNRGPGISLAFQWNNQLIFLLDDRSFRKKKYSKDRYAHWGKEQEDWILELISKNNSGPVWLMNGSQIFPKMVLKESLSGNHKEQFKGFINKLKNLSSKVVFVSGDVHFSEITKVKKDILGYQTYEITSSSIHSKNIPGSLHIFPNPNRIAGTGARNYVLIDAMSDANNLNLEVTCYNQNGKKQFQLQLDV